MNTFPSFKRGDTFSFSASFEQDGDPVTGLESKLRCQIRDEKDNLIDDLTISTTGTPGTYIFRADSTETWPAPSNLRLDIELHDGDIISSTETIIIPVRKDVTRDG